MYDNQATLNHLRKKKGGGAIFLVLYYCQVLVEISQKLGICHVRRPVSRDRQILFMEMKVGNPTHAAYLPLIF